MKYTSINKLMAHFLNIPFVMEWVPDLLIGSPKDMWHRKLMVESDILNTRLCSCLELLHWYMRKDTEYYTFNYRLL